MGRIQHKPQQRNAQLIAKKGSDQDRAKQKRADQIKSEQMK